MGVNLRVSTSACLTMDRVLESLLFLVVVLVAMLLYLLGSSSSHHVLTHHHVHHEATQWQFLVSLHRSFIPYVDILLGSLEFVAHPRDHSSIVYT